MDIQYAVRYVAIKSFWFFARPLQQAYRRIFRPANRSVKVIVENCEKILLVRPNYAHRLWSLPGGGLNIDESFEDAASRELREEIGITLHSPLEFLGTYPSKHPNFDVRAFFASTMNSLVSVDGIEIREAEWFDPKVLPEDRSLRMDPIIALYLQKRKIRS